MTTDCSNVEFFLCNDECNEVHCKYIFIMAIRSTATKQQARRRGIPTLREKRYLNKINPLSIKLMSKLISSRKNYIGNLVCQGLLLQIELEYNNVYLSLPSLVSLFFQPTQDDAIAIHRNIIIVIIFLYLECWLPSPLDRKLVLNKSTLKGFHWFETSTRLLQLVSNAQSKQ